MFEFVHNNRRGVGIMLGLVTLGLMIGFGATGFTDAGNEPYLAKVDGVKITERDMAEATQGQAVPEAVKPQIVQQLVQRQLLQAEGGKRHIYIDDAQLEAEIRKIDAFKEKGQFSIERYKTMLAARQMSIAEFERKLRQDLSLQRLIGGLSDSTISSKLVAQRLAETMSQLRSVQSVSFKPADFVASAQVSEAEIKRYYDSNLPKFARPERLKLSYVQLSKEAMAQKITVDGTKLESYFNAHKGELAPEERQVRHILIAADKSASKDQKAAAKQKASDLLAQLKAAPAKFSELAKQHSQDPGSAAQGGEMPFFGRGAMVKPFEDVAYKLRQGEISELVETEFGFHIIVLDGIRSKTLAELKDVVEQRIRLEEAGKRFASESEKLGELAYQQADSLKPLVEAFGLTEQESDWVSRDQGAEPLFSVAKVREGVFAEDVIKGKHNSEVLEVASGNVVVARLKQYEAARQQPLAEVRAQILALLTQESASKLAQAAGEKALASLRKGENLPLAWSQSQDVSRIQAQGLDKIAQNAVFGLALTDKPGFAGAKQADGYQVYRVALAPAQARDPRLLQDLQTSVGQLASEQALQAYVASLGKQYKVEMR